MLTVIDISQHQGPVNWDRIEQAYRAGQLHRVIIRSSYGTVTGAQTDTQFTRNRDQARARSIPLGFYHFAYPGRSPGVIQANAMASIIGRLQPGELIALDLEDEPTAGRLLTAADVAWAREWVATARSILGVTPLVYMAESMIRRFNWAPLIDLGCPLWAAKYGPGGQPATTAPASNPWPHWHLWQYTSQASLAGISPLDVSWFAGTAADLARLGLPTPTPSPNPPQGDHDMAVAMNYTDIKTYVEDSYEAAGNTDKRGMRGWIGQACAADTPMTVLRTMDHQLGHP